MRLHQPTGGFLLLWPTLWALTMGKLEGKLHRPVDPSIAFVFIIGVWLMRSAGCILNDLIDQSFDAKVSRTRKRPLVTKEVSQKEAIVLLCILLFLSAALLLFLNLPTLLLAMVGLCLTVLYPFMKRITYWPQLVLGVAFSWSIPMIFVAQNKALSFMGGILFLIALLWPIGYDTIYALMDKDEDKKIGLKSTALLWGKHTELFISFIYLSMLSLLIVLGALLLGQWPYYVALLGVFLAMNYQMYLVKSHNTAHYLKAFQSNNYIGFFIFVGLYFR